MKCHLFPTPDSTEPRDEDLPRDEGSKLASARWAVGGLIIVVLAGTVVVSALLGLGAAVAWTVFHALTGGFR